MKLVTPLILALALSCSFSSGYADSKEPAPKATKDAGEIKKKGKRKNLSSRCASNVSGPRSGGGGACTVAPERFPTADR